MYALSWTFKSPFKKRSRRGSLYAPDQTFENFNASNLSLIDKLYLSSKTWAGIQYREMFGRVVNAKLHQKISYGKNVDLVLLFPKRIDDVITCGKKESA